MEIIVEVYRQYDGSLVCKALVGDLTGISSPLQANATFIEKHVVPYTIKGAMSIGVKSFLRGKGRMDFLAQLCLGLIQFGGRVVPGRRD